MFIVEKVLLNKTRIIRYTQWCTRGGGGQGRNLPPPFGTQKQHNFADITQFVTLCHIYFSRNNHLS